MITEHVDRRTVRSALRLAARAPSLRNSQPWRFALGASSVHVYADLSQWLPATDPDGRGLMQSCGAVLHHLRVAFAVAGLSTSVHRLPDPDRPDHLAAVGLRPSPPAEAHLGLAAAISRRRTDHRRFGGREVPGGFLHELAGSAAEQGAVLRHVPGTRRGSLLLAAIRDAAAEQQEAEAAYRTEPALQGGRGADLKEPADDGAARRFGTGLLQDAGPEPQDGAAVMVLGTASDDPLSQLRAGEALSAVLLHATELGLASCALGEPLEVGWIRARIRDEILGGTLFPQLVLRVGRAPAGPPLPPTPRRPVAWTIDRLRP